MLQNTDDNFINWRFKFVIFATRKTIEHGKAHVGESWGKNC